MNYANIKYDDIANGPGVRTSLFVSGCTHACKGCFNEVAWDFKYGEEFGDETIEKIMMENIVLGSTFARIFVFLQNCSSVRLYQS